MRALNERERPIGVADGPLAKPRMEKERLGNEQHDGKDRPYKRHRRHPPEVRIEEAIPGLQAIGHVKAAEAGERDRDFRLKGKTPFDFLEDGDAAGRFGKAPHRRQQDGGDQAYAADPMDERENVDKARKGKIVHGLARGSLRE